MREIVDSTPPGIALDAACGTGRHCRYLLERGHDVIGVDASPEMLAKARAAAPAAEFHEGDLLGVAAGRRQRRPRGVRSGTRARRAVGHRHRRTGARCAAGRDPRAFRPAPDGRRPRRRRLLPGRGRWRRRRPWASPSPRRLLAGLLERGTGRRTVHRAVVHGHRGRYAGPVLDVHPRGCPGGLRRRARRRGDLGASQAFPSRTYVRYTPAVRWRLAEDDSTQGALFEEEVERHIGRGEFRGMEFLHVNARSIINEIPAASQLPFRWTINAYQGLLACV